MCLSRALFLALAVNATAVPCLAVDVGNGDFENDQNTSWFFDGSNTPKVVQGDKPSIKMAPNGNNYMHIGDADGRGVHGENLSRVFQWFSSADTTSIAPHCKVSFRFRTLLLSGELAWARMKSAQQQRVWAIPNSNNQWAALRGSVTLPNECDKMLFLEFGMIKQAGGNNAGRLNIDDVEFDRIAFAPGPPLGGNWNFLPQEPQRDSSTVVAHDEATLVYFGGGNQTMALLVVSGLFLVVWRLGRRDGNRRS